MISRLKRKIFWIIQISLSLIIIGGIALTIIFSYKNTISSSSKIMQRIDGKSVNIEGIYWFRLSNNKIIMESNNVTEEIRAYANKLSNRNTEKGYIGNYTYIVRKLDKNQKIVTLMENGNLIKELKITIISALIFVFFAIIIVCIISKKISELIVKPVQDSFEKQKQFISDASHELKTPLAVIEANADVLQKKLGENKWVTYIQNEAESMNKLVNDLLTLARIGNITNTNKQMFDVSKEVKISIAGFESMIYENNIELETNISDGVYFNGDKQDIKHIISILLDNAIKHTPDNKKIVVDFYEQKNHIKIEVKNQGEPIPANEREKIFDRFYRADKSRNRDERRYGLGLSIAKGIVEKYNGKITVISEDGFTNFTVYLNK